MADLSDELFALGFAEDVDAGVEGADADGVCASRDSILVVHGCDNVLDYGGAVVVEDFAGT